MYFHKYNNDTKSSNSQNKPTKNHHNHHHSNSKKMTNKNKKNNKSRKSSSTSHRSIQTVENKFGIFYYIVRILLAILIISLIIYSILWMAIAPGDRTVWDILSGIMLIIVCLFGLLALWCNWFWSIIIFGLNMVIIIIIGLINSVPLVQWLLPLACAMLAFIYAYMLYKAGGADGGCVPCVCCCIC